MAQLFTFALGTTGKAATTGYEFYDSSGASLGARSVTGVTEFGTSGIYFRTQNLPAGAVAVVWDDTDTGKFAVDDAIGVKDANVVSNAGTAITSAAGIQEVKVASMANNAITAASINADAITNAKIADDAIAVENIKDGAITAPKIASDAITAAKIADGAITAAKVADGAITAAKVATGAIDADAIASDAVDKIALGHLKYDESTITGEPDYCPLNAHRSARNDWDTTTNAGKRTVFKEDGTTEAFAQTLTTDPNGEPITGATTP